MLEPIRILHVFGNLNAGGAESRTMDIYRAIDKKKIQFDFAIHTENECFFTNEVNALGGRIYTFPRFNGRNYFKYRNAWYLFFKDHPEYKIVHGHQTNTGFLYLNEAKKNNVPVRIAHSRSSNKENIIKKYICKMSKLYASHLFAVSKLAGISEFGGRAISKGKVKILPNAIDGEKYSFDKVIRQKKRSELGLNDELTICHIGRFQKVKNHAFLVNIFKNIYERKINVKLVLIGDGELKEYIKAEIKRLNLINSVILTGIREDVPELLQAMDILVFPSLYEGLPGVVLEAQAAGLPCIISDTITEEVKITELVDYMSLKKSPEDWADKVLNFGTSFKRRNTYNDIVKAGYDIKMISNWYENFYIKSYLTSKKR